MPPSPHAQGAKVLSLASGGRLVAAACAGGGVRLFSAASLEPMAELPPPAAPAPAVACALSPDGGALVASYGPGAVARWDVSEPLRPAMQGASLVPCHRCACGCPVRLSPAASSPGPH